MNLGKDFWWIVRILELVVKFFTWLNQHENGDNPPPET